jgi:hypothetical protein
MSTTKLVMSGVADLRGQRVNSLLVGEMVNRHPAPRYKVKCERCGCETTFNQRQLTSGVARCLASDCGKAKLREYINDTPRKARLREAERERAIIDAAGKELKSNAGKLHAVIRERIEKGKDDGLFVSPALVNARMTQEQAAKHNAESGRIFLSRNPWFYNSPANLDVIIQYFLRNNINVIDAEMWERAAKRLQEYQLLPDERPQPESIQEPAPEPIPEPGQQTSQPESFEGYDLQSGQPRMYSRREIDRMSSDEYRRVFRIYRDDLRLPNRGPGPRGRTQ